MPRDHTGNRASFLFVGLAILVFVVWFYGKLRRNTYFLHLVGKI